MLLLSLLLQAPASAAPNIAYEQFELDNGLTVLLVEDHRLPKVVVDTWYHVGSYDDPMGASGFAHLFEHLMFKGTPNVAEGEFDRVMEAAGGSNNASTGDDITNYFDWGPSSILDLLLVMEADRMTGLDVTQDKLDREREVVHNERRQNWEDPPYADIWNEIPRMLFPEDHLYYRNGIGTQEELDAATLDTVTSFYDTWYVPNNATLVVAGDFDPAWTAARIRELFGPLQVGEVPDHRAYPTVTEPVVREKTITDDVQLPALVMAWHSPVLYEEGDADLDIYSDLLTGGDDARITRRLVIEEQSVQEIHAFQASAKRGSTYMVMAYLSPDADIDGVKAAIIEEMQAVIGDAPPTDEEVTIAVRGYEMGFLRRLESITSRAETLQGYLYHTGNPDYLAKDLARYNAVTPDGIVSAVETWLDPEKAAVLIVLPEATEDTPEEGQ